MSARTARLAALVPLLAAVVIVVTLAIMSRPIDFLDEPSVVAFAVALLALLLAPHVLLAVILFRASRVKWLWRTAAVGAVLSTVAQLLVCGVLLTEDDPQTPILLVFYAPAQLGAVLLILAIGFLASRIRRRTRVS